MWDYLVRILKTEDVPRRASTPEIPHPADAAHGIRSSTEAGGDAEVFAATGPPPEALYCPACHVRMRHDRSHGVEASICPECNGAFLTEAALKEMLGAFIELTGDEKNPLIYTPHGLSSGPGDSHRSDQA